MNSNFLIGPVQAKQPRSAFTLIELLIVVAIIAILAAIAVPNFLEAQTRAKISRVKADIRTISTGLETYVIDHNKYPPDWYAWGGLAGCFHLTTPVAHISSFPLDPFHPHPTEKDKFLAYMYMNYQKEGLPNSTWALRANLPDNLARKSVCVLSIGPDRFRDAAEWVVLGMSAAMNRRGVSGKTIDTIYDATNGTLSWGDVVRLTGDTRGLPQQL